jgi:predicted dehydrogenase
MCVPLPLPGNIRFKYELAGGATMDTGAYAVHMLRHLAGAEPEVTRAEARLASPKIDRWMTADFTFADGRTGKMTCSLFSSTLLRISARVVGDRGEMFVFNPVLPQLYHRLTVRTESGTTVERVAGRATYEHQLRAFADSVLNGAPVLTSAEDAVRNMRTIDRIYQKAGLPVRGEG